jgi:poly-gamma-glutamate capsule biosynthesis protein CapA/YwtB (metallophosphatase superfamily)
MRLFLCGDVMLGRGIDQALPSPCSPEIHEHYLRSAMDYVRLAEQANGRLALPLDYSYVWGAALEELEQWKPAARLINLETSITRCSDFVPKGINYRLSPDNARCLSAAAIDCCALANNHVLDWGREGLAETLSVLTSLGIKSAGAGANMPEASQPAFLENRGRGRVAFFSLACATTGIPSDWAASDQRPGINLVPDLSETTAAALAERIVQATHPSDIAIVSIHWGPNWGYRIPGEQRRFAHSLIDRARVSMVHGHSSHHAKAIEIYRNRLILYGCGDFLNDYEGIGGREEYRGDLAIMYLPEIDSATGELVTLTLVPLQIRRFQLNRASSVDVDWLARRLDLESRPLGTKVIKPSPSELRLVAQPAG